MRYVQLKARENPIASLLRGIRTGRSYASYHDMPLEVSKGIELYRADSFCEASAFKVFPEISYEITLGVRLKDNGHASEVATRMFSQHLYSPILDDLSTIEMLLLDGDREQALNHLNALKHFLIGSSYG